MGSDHAPIYLIIDMKFWFFLIKLLKTIIKQKFEKYIFLYV